MTSTSSVLVCGSRAWCDPRPIRDRLALLPKGTTVLHGAAVGADQLASQVCSELGLREVAFLPNYGREGRRAPLERNKRMLDERPSVVIAFWDGNSMGTAHTMSEARKRGIPVEVIR